jgi:hypothetical protein
VSVELHTGGVISNSSTAPTMAMTAKACLPYTAALASTRLQPMRNRHQSVEDRSDDPMGSAGMAGLSWAAVGGAGAHG